MSPEKRLEEGVSEVRGAHDLGTYANNCKSSKLTLQAAPVEPCKCFGNNTG